MTIDELFVRYAEALVETSEVDHRLIDGDVFKVYETSELTLLSGDGTKLKRDPNKDIGVSFELFGEDVVLTKQGALSVTMKDENDEMAVYPLSDPDLRKTTLGFLLWRLKVLEGKGF